MRHRSGFIGALAVFTLLAGCAVIPRGAGLQTEVLAVERDRDGIQTSPKFAVEVVTRDNLVTFLHWPDVGEDNLPWVDRIDQPNTRTIAAGDFISLIVWTTEENGLLTAPGQRSVTLPDLRVSSSGTVFLPYVGNQRVRGMSPEHARAMIEEKYMTVTLSAQVQLSLSEGRARVVSLIGGVGAPGSYPLPDNDFTLLGLIAEGGGISPDLINPQVRLHRNERIHGVSASRLLNTPRLDTTLEGGDKIFVQEDTQTFLSLGAAGTEAVHPFPRDRLSALEALSIIGGITDTRANAKGILILRSYPMSALRHDRSGPSHLRTVFTLDLTSADGLFSADQFDIQHGDLVYVTESPVTALASIFRLLGSASGLGNQLR